MSGLSEVHSHKLVCSNDKWALMISSYLLDYGGLSVWGLSITSVLITVLIKLLLQFLSITDYEAYLWVEFLLQLLYTTSQRYMLSHVTRPIYWFLLQFLHTTSQLSHVTRPPHYPLSWERDSTWRIPCLLSCTPQLEGHRQTWRGILELTREWPLWRS